MARIFFVAVLLLAGSGRTWAQASAGAAGMFKPAPPAAPPATSEPPQKKAPPTAQQPAAPPPPAATGTPPAASQAYPPPPAPVAPAPPAPAAGATAPAGAPPSPPPPGYYPPPPGYPPLPPGYPPPPPGYAYPGYPPPPGTAYPGYPYQPYPGAYYPTARAVARPGRHEHDGFFLRMNFGFGASDLKTDNAGSTTELSGGGGELAVAIGAAVTRNLILYGEFSSIFFNPDLKVAGQSRSSGSGDVSVFSIGPGLAYYFGEGNYYASATLSFAQLQFNDLNISRTNKDSDWGVSFRAMFGKEWWVSDNWGLGAALTLTLASIKDGNLRTDNAGGDTPQWKVAAFGLLFSATYN